MGTGPYRILLVDDDAVDREQVRRALEACGLPCALDEAPGAAEAFAERNIRGYDCLILDCRFPEGDSLELFHDLFVQTCDRRPPIVVLTGMGDQMVAVNAMKNGAQDYLTKDRISPLAIERAITGAIMKADFERSLERRTRDLEKRLEERTQKLEWMSFYDPLTRLPNRILLADRLEQTLRVNHRNRARFAVMFMDLNGFKEVNDSFGHDAGDAVLRRVADRLQGAMRGSDTLARVGGDEFVAVLPTTDTEEGIAMLAQKLCAAVRDSIEFNGRTLRVGLSLGVAFYPDHGLDSGSLLAAADAAMYDSKRGSRGFAIFDPARSSDDQRIVELASALPRAIESGQIVLHYQPQIDLATGALAGAEALVRWQHPDHGLLSPAEFVPVAEKYAAIQPLTLLVVRQALAQARTWRDRGRELPVSVNYSPRLLDDEDMPEQVIAALRATGLEPGFLTLEITESGIATSPHLAAAVVRRYSDAGIRISLDDFGTGYSSLKNLHDCAIDEIKIDRAFTRSLDGGREVSIIRAVVELGRGLAARIVAEGIETREMWHALAELGCEYGQGYHIGRPVGPAGLQAWREDWERTNPQKGAKGLRVVC